MNAKQLVSIQADFDTSQVCGAIVFWTLTGPVHRDRFADALAEAGIPHEYHPRDISVREALKRALQEGTRQQPRHMLRPLGGEGYAVVREQEEGEDGGAKLKHTTLFEVRVKGDDWETTYGKAWPCEEVLRDTYRHELCHLNASDISHWLLSTYLIPRTDAVSLRPATGGVYFIPQTHVAKVEALKVAFRRCSDHEIYMVPAVSAETAIEAIFEGLRVHVSTAMVRLEEGLAQYSDNAKALQRRADETRGLVAKIDRYRSILGDAVEGIAGQAQALEARFCTAALLASAGGE